MIKLAIIALVLVSVATYVISSYPTVTSFTIKENNLTKITKNADIPETNLITGNVIETSNQNNAKNDFETKELQEITSGPNEKFNVSVEVIS